MTHESRIAPRGPENHAHHHHDHDHDHGDHGPLAALREVFLPHSHDAADSIVDALQSSAAGIRAVKISLLALGVTALAQFVIVAISGSVALLADSVDFLEDTAVILLIAVVDDD